MCVCKRTKFTQNEIEKDAVKDVEAGMDQDTELLSDDTLGSG